MAALKTVKAQAKGLEGFYIEAKVGNHTVFVDQARDGGGMDKAPTPLDYTFVALASCLITIGKIVAFQQKINLRGMEVSVEGGLNLDVLRGKEMNERSGFKSIQIQMSIDADMTQEEKEKFAHEVERRCPVSDNLLNTTPLEVMVH